MEADQIEGMQTNIFNLTVKWLHPIFIVVLKLIIQINYQVLLIYSNTYRLSNQSSSNRFHDSLNSLIFINIFYFPRTETVMYTNFMNTRDTVFLQNLRFANVKFLCGFDLS